VVEISWLCFVLFHKSCLDHPGKVVANMVIYGITMQELEGRPLRLSLAEQNPLTGSPPSTVQAQHEETASDTSDAEAEATSASDLDESALQTTAAF
jgi:hypothetical protein